jgi:putative type-1 restriction enzyme hindVIIP specificity protein
MDFDPWGGRMPAFWQGGTIADIGQNIVCGKTPSTKREEYYGDDTPFITIPDMHSQIYVIKTARYLSLKGKKSQSTKTLPKNSVCVSCIGTAGLVSLTAYESQTNQQINSIVPRNGISPYYIYYVMKGLSDTIQRLGSSGSTIVNMNKTHFAKLDVIVPDTETMQKFDYDVKPLFDLILLNQITNTHLASLREEILPNLMSGETDVSNINF